MDDEIKAKIQDLRNRTPEFDPFFRALGLRSRNASVTELNKFVNNQELAVLGPEYKRRRLAIKFFKALAEVGAGDFRIGRRRSPTRFSWLIPMLDVAHAAAPRASRHENGAVSPNAFEGEGSEGIRSTALAHRYVLREDFTVTLDLPLDLTPTEADRLSAMIKTLPLERQSKGEEE